MISSNLPSAGLQGTSAESQEEVQRVLRCAHDEHGFGRALEILTSWSESSGYLRREDLLNDKLLSVPISAYDNTFLLQLNASRKKYSSPPSGSPREQDAADCALCFENVGSESKPLLRAYEFELRGRSFFIQLTPFPLHDGHYVLIDRAHRPMELQAETFNDLNEFLELAPDFTACSNSDIMWAGASILAHHHYQVFKNLTLPVMTAPVDERYVRERGGVRTALLRYPATALRFHGRVHETIAQAGEVLAAWKSSDPGRATANIVAKRRGTELTIHMLLRHSEHRTAERWRELKREGVGVLEIAGMIIIPAPGGNNAGQKQSDIIDNAAEIVQDIISSNSPIRPDERSGFFARFVAAGD